MASALFLIGVIGLSLTVSDEASYSQRQDMTESTAVPVEPVVIPSTATHIALSDIQLQETDVEVLPSEVLHPQNAVEMTPIPNHCSEDCGSSCDGCCDDCQHCCGIHPACHAFWSRFRVVCPKPSCNMSQHLPYQVPGTYYYYRPYSPIHIESQRQESSLWNARRDLPYSNTNFQRVYENIETELGLER